jgi:hypothetical protein
MIIYYSNNCANSARLISIVQRIPSLSSTVKLLDVQTLSPAERSGLQFVPTVVDDEGRQHVGTKAFDLMKRYEEEMDLQSAPLSGGRLAFSSLEGFGETEYADYFGDFTAP